MRRLLKFLHFQRFHDIKNGLIKEFRGTAALIHGLDWETAPHAVISLIAGSALVGVVCLLIAGAA